jgi:DNA-binding LacI/PurR family transcriptional regulator
MNPPVNATIEDVAIAAGVSVATVSRALRDLPNVAPSTREKVRAVAKDLAYVSNPSASRLAAGRTGTVAVVVPMFDAWYFSNIVAGIEAVLKDRHVDLLLYAVGSEEDRSAFFAGRGAWWRRSDGLVIVDVALSDDVVARLHNSGARIVTIGSRTERFSSVTLDEQGAAASAAHRLIGLGHRRIGVIGGEALSADFRVPMLRLEGFQQAMIDAGVAPNPELARNGNFSIEGGAEAMAELLSLGDPPTAVFALSDEMAFGALAEMRRRGLSAPDDVAIVGFDDHQMSELLELTTVRQPVETVGAMAGRLVLDVIKDRSAPVEHLVVPTELIVRSTG